MGREWLPAEGGVVLHEAPVALDVGHVDAFGRGDPLAAGVGERPVSVRAVDEERRWRHLLLLTEMKHLSPSMTFISLSMHWIIFNFHRCRVGFNKPN